MVEHNLIIETANKIINKQGKSVMLDFFTNCSDLCHLSSLKWNKISLSWRTISGSHLCL